MNCSQIGNSWSFYIKLRCSLCAVHVVVCNEGDFACCLPCLQEKALQEAMVSVHARASSSVNVGRAPRPCGSPQLGSSSSLFSSLGQGAAHLTCPVLFSPKTQRLHLLEAVSCLHLCKHPEVWCVEVTMALGLVAIFMKQFAIGHSVHYVVESHLVTSCL